jgi:LmbE family N-acetylglucosaminyl deacetylase
MKYILLIEDDKILLDMLQNLIKRKTACKVITAGNGKEAKQLLLEKSWDIVISDINLPDCSGLELVEFIKEHNELAKILMITGNSDSNNAIKALNLRVDAYLLKPFDHGQFINTINKLKTQVNKKTSSLKVLAIGAHPDDVEIGCGGTLLNHKDKGDQIHILTLSNGEKGGNSSIRALEARKASGQLGSQLTLCNLIDTEISSGHETISIIENIIKKFKPDLIYTHSKNDNHQDHRNVHKATIVAARSTASIESYQSPSASIDFKPSRFVDVSKQMKNKLRLIKCYATQFTKCKYLNRSIIQANAMYWGRYANYSLVEPFEVIRSVK